MFNILHFSVNASTCAVLADLIMQGLYTRASCVQDVSDAVHLYVQHINEAVLVHTHTSASRLVHGVVVCNKYVERHRYSLT